MLVDGGGERRERQCGPVASGPVATNLRGVWESMGEGKNVLEPWLCMPLVPILGKLRQENSEFEVSLDYIETLCHTTKKPKQQTNTTPPSRNHHSAGLLGCAVECRRCPPHPPCVPGSMGNQLCFCCRVALVPGLRPHHCVKDAKARWQACAVDRYCLPGARGRWWRAT